MNYVELHARSAFSFLRGASEPCDLADTAAHLGMATISLCDRDGVYGTARMHAAAKENGQRALVGSELTLEDGSILPVLVENRTGYQNLCRLITRSKLRGTKTESSIRWNELPEFSEGLVALTGDEEGVLRNPENTIPLDRLLSTFGANNVFVEIQRHHRRNEQWRNDHLIDIARAKKLPLLATNGVLHAVPEEREVLDLFTCIRNHTHLDAAGRLLSENAERHLKSPKEMALLFADLPDAITNTERLANRLDFTLENLGYEFPKYEVPSGHDADSFLRQLAFEGARLYYKKLQPNVRDQLEKELGIIQRLGFSGYFLIVWDIVQYCKKNDILVQGRGSAANSVVCFSLGITACDPIEYKLLFERFLSEGRGSNSWPDIDLDLPSGERREKVIQEIYQRYGKHGAAMTANVITYRGRSAMREIGKALNLSTDVLDRFSSLFANGDFHHTLGVDSQLRQSGLPVDHPRAGAILRLYDKIRGLPRHLGQHSGGMIICQNALSTIVPLENASMPGRVVAQWDKNDCEDLGIIKVDLLGLGMMSAMQDIFTLCEKEGPRDFQSIPKEDPEVYKMLQSADTIGTFQVESRAQMATLPRFKPTKFYDIVMQVAIIRPGPIQGGMLSKLMERRDDNNLVAYIHEDLKETLERTLGVPLFQEQLLKMAMVMAGFSGSEAEELRRALSFHRSHKQMNKVCEKLRRALAERNVEPDKAEELVQNIQSFAVYGFPESHAISFALIAYASCWLKARRAPEFYASLLNNQPMGFYSSSTLIRDAKARSVKIRPISILYSQWNCTIEADDAIRLGLRMVRGMDSATGKRIAEEQNIRPFSSLEDFRRRVAPDRPALRVLARIGALNGLVDHRRDGLWKAEFPLRPDDLPGFHLENETPAPLAPMTDFQRLEADFAGTGVTTGKHPMAFVRADLPEITRASDLFSVPNGKTVRIAGLVICRQRPGTAKGVVFASLEDETGVANAILAPEFFEKHRLTITQENFLIISGPLQNHRGTIHIKARHVEALSFGEFATPGSHDFH